MTTRSSSTCPDDSLIRPAPVTVGVRVPPVRVLTRSAPPAGSRAQKPPEAGHQEDRRYDDPLLDLVRTAVTTRPLEDVVRLLTLLESSPEHARTSAEASRVAGLDRSVEDVTRLVALLTRPPRDPAGADAVLRAAAGQRPLADVGRLLRLLHRTPLEPHCARTAVQAVASGRPVEEVAELIGRLAAEQPGCEPSPPECAATAPEPVGPAESAGRRHPQPSRTPPCRPPRIKLLRLEPTPRAALGPAPAGHPPAPGPGLRSPAETGVRAAAVLVFLCGAAHAPRYWAGLSHGLLGATLVVSALCMLLGLALPARSPHARLGAAAAALAVTAGLGAGQLLGGRFGLPDPARLWAATLAPPWLAGTAAAVAALAALAVVPAVLLGVRAPGDQRSVKAPGDQGRTKAPGHQGS
ncbi:hypothetical protein ABT298_34840 [Streptomyces sp. NPDC001034]|uniref:hypothetical protein n=1 Tax=Streptomyces sp. NPDC001034 TaxID=3154375 RepID=UPI003333DB91